MRRAQLVPAPRAGAGDVEAGELLHEVSNVLQGVNLLEQLIAAARWQERAARVAAKGAAIHARVSEYAERNHLRYLQVDTPAPEAPR